MKVIRIILTFSLCNVALTSNAMLVRAVQPIAKRIASRFFTPKVTPQVQSIQRTLQLPAQTVKAASVKPANSFCSRSTQYMKLFKARPHYRHYYTTRPSWWLPTALGIGAVAASTQDHAYAESDNSDQTKQYSVQQQYRSALEEEGTKLMNDFLRAINRTKEQWEQESVTLQQGPFLKNVETTIKNNQQRASQAEPLSPKLQNTIAELLKQHGVDPQMVTFIRDDSHPFMGVCGIPAIGKIGFTINERICNYLPQKEVEWAVLHEIQHLKHNDSFMAWVNTNGRHANNILYKYRIFFEKRADILAALTSLDHSKAAADYNMRLWNSYSWFQKLFHAFRIKNVACDDGLHPTIAQSITYTTKLYEEMLACTEQQKRIS